MKGEIDLLSQETGRIFFVTDKGEVMGVMNKRFPRKVKKKMKRNGTWFGAHNFAGFPYKRLF